LSVKNNKIKEKKKMLKKKIFLFFEHWFYSTNHKDIGTLFLLFARLSGLLSTILSVLLLFEFGLVLVNGLIMFFFTVTTVLLGRGFVNLAFFLKRRVDLNKIVFGNRGKEKGGEGEKKKKKRLPKTKMRKLYNKILIFVENIKIAILEKKKLLSDNKDVIIFVLIILFLLIITPFLYTKYIKPKVTFFTIVFICARLSVISFYAFAFFAFIINAFKTVQFQYLGRDKYRFFAFCSSLSLIPTMLINGWFLVIFSFLAYKWFMKCIDDAAYDRKPRLLEKIGAILLCLLAITTYCFFTFCIFILPRLH
jgi:hypothetical protein